VACRCWRYGCGHACRTFRNGRARHLDRFNFCPVRRGRTNNYCWIDPALLRSAFHPRSVAQRFRSNYCNGRGVYYVIVRGRRCVEVAARPISTDLHRLATLVRVRRRRRCHCCSACNWVHCCPARTATAQRTDRRHCRTRSARRDDRNCYFLPKALSHSQRSPR